MDRHEKPKSVVKDDKSSAHNVSKIVYTLTDEAPALATRSLMPICGKD